MLSFLGGGVIGLIIKQLIVIEVIEVLYRLPAPLLVFFFFLFLTGPWLNYSVPQPARRLSRLFPIMATQAGLASGLFDLPINATSKLRQHGR